MLDGSYQSLVEKVGSGRIIRRFDRTPYPVRPNDVVCPHFMELAWSWGCKFDCSFCYLKGTFRFFQDKKTGRVLPHFKDRTEIARACKAFIGSKSPPEILNAGELSDSLMQERGDPWSSFIQPIFQGSRHKVLHLTKDVAVQNFLKNDWQDNAILSWTVNEPEVSRTWEKLAPEPISRLEAAGKVSEAGHKVRLRIDPIVPIMDYQERLDSESIPSCRSWITKRSIGPS